MGIIKVLPENVKNMIAAGEVVAGPYSVIKELVENSIDAGASRISVSVFDSGLKKIIISDNGCGISKEDLPLAIAEHATSKITDIDDIYSIFTYGFRGEALSSISSVSTLTIMSRRAEDETGGKIICDAGDTANSDYMGPAGTIINVENLFYNTPARKKFLKSMQSELRLVKDTFYSIALANPSISFSLAVDDKTPVTLPAVPSISDRIRQVAGIDADGLLYGELSDMDTKIFGYISRPDKMKRTRSEQYLFVNSRPIEHRLLNFHLSRAYDGLYSDGYPAAYIYIEIKPDLVDINIHPSKREVKFFDAKYVESLIYSLAKKILGSRSFSISEELEASHGSEHADKIRPAAQKAHEETAYRQAELLSPGISFISDEPIAPIKAQSQSTDDFVIIGTLFDTYILLEKENEFTVIDYHAAHERMIYDRMVSRISEDEITPLIFPETIELSLRGFSYILDSLDELNAAGFSIDQLSENSFAVSAVPAFLKGIDIRSFLSDYADSADHSVYRTIKNEIAAKAACHSARRAGDRISRDEIAEIARKVLHGSMEKRCPHGRPFLFSITRDEFEKLFRRSR